MSSMTGILGKLQSLIFSPGVLSTHKISASYSQLGSSQTPCCVSQMATLPLFYSGPSPLLSTPPAPLTIHIDSFIAYNEKELKTN